MALSSEMLSLPGDNFFQDYPGQLGLADIGPLSVLLMSLLPVGNVEGGIFSRITMTSMTSAWYLRLSHFEAILVGLVVLQIFVLSYLTVLPLDLTQLIEEGNLLATSYSRRKRSLDYSKAVEQQRLAETMFSVLRRVDEHDCLLRTLCELEFKRDRNIQEFMSSYPKGISQLLASLKRFGHKRIRRESMVIPNNVTISERKVLSEFEDAVLFGSGRVNDGMICDADDGTNLDNMSCANQYSLCEADKDELLHYVKKMGPLLL